jgi:hypothetical protein
MSIDVSVLDPRVKKAIFVFNDATEGGNNKARRVLREAAMYPEYAREAFTTSDFPALFQQAVNAITLAKYTTTPALWPAWASRQTVPNLMKQNFIDLVADMSNLPTVNGGAPTLPGALPRVPEGTPYPAVAFTGSQSSIWTYKLGARLAFTWEAFQSDNWGVISNLPTALNTIAKRTEDLAATAALLDVNGFRSDVWDSAHHLQASTQFGTLINAPLSFNSLQAALAQAGLSPDPTRVNVITKWALLVPRNLELIARNIVNTTQVEMTGTDGSKLFVNNTLGSAIEVVVNPYIPVISSSATYKATMWALVPANGNGSDRTAIAEVFKLGDETPELRIKSDAGQAFPGGGDIAPLEGSFDTDDIEIRIRHFVNAVVTDPLRVGFVCSEGDGT